MKIESHRDLRVWQVGMDIAEQCYRLTREFPREEMFGMTSQIRRAAGSIAANIAEGYGRNKRGDYVQFLRIARGSIREVETHLTLAFRVGLCPEPAASVILARCEDAGRMITALIKSLETTYAHESPAEYDAEVR